MHRGLGVEGEDVGARVGVLGDVLLRPLDHQVDVEGTVGEPPERPDHRRAEREVGHEVPVHHVDVDPLGAAGDGLLELLAQPAEVGAQHARRDPRAHRPPAGGPLTTRSIREPRGRPLPGEGRVAMTTPGSGPPPRTVSTRPTRMPAATTTFSA